MSDDLHALVSEAEDYFSQRDWDLAVEKYQKVMQLDPQNEEACSKLARVFAVRGLISNVITQYFQLMQILEDKGELDLALEIARWVMQLQPENDKARLAQISILRKQGHNEEVVRQSLQLARLYIELGMGDQSIELLKNAQEMEPENLDIGYELAEMYVSHGHISEGASQFRQIANSFLGKEQYEKAADAFKRMKVIQPDDPSLLFTLGNIYVTLGRLNDAEAEFRSILRHDLNHLEALLALGNVCQQKGQFRDAILAFNKILSINPQENVAKEKLGELYQAQGNANEAIKQFLGAAHAFQQVEENEKATRLYWRVVALDPTNPTACRELTNMGAPMQPDDPAELGSSYQPVIAPVGPEPQPAVARTEEAVGQPVEEERPTRGRGSRSRAKSEAAGAGTLVPRGGGNAAAGGGKAMLPRPGMMNARGGGGLVAKGDGGPAALKPRLGGGEKPSMARSRTSEVSPGKKQMMRRGGTEERPDDYDEPTVEAPQEDPGFEQGTPVAQAEQVPFETAEQVPFETESPEHCEPERFEAPVMEAPEPEAVYEDSPDAAPVEEDSGTGPSLEDFDPTMFPSLETPTGREEMGEPVPPVPAPEVAALEPQAETQNEPYAEPPAEGASGRAPLQPRLFARGGGRSGSKPSRPVLGSGGGAMRGKSESSSRSGKPTLPVRGQQQAEVAETPAEALHSQAEPEVEPVAQGGPESVAAHPEAQPVPSEANAATREQFDAPLMPSGLDSTQPEAGEPGATQPTVINPPPVVESLPTAGTMAPSGTPFDGARALEELSRAMPEDAFAAPGEAAEAVRLEEYMGSGDMARAILAFRQQLEQNPNDFALRARLADALFVSGIVEEAAAEYLQLAHLDPENLAVLHRLVETYLWSGQPERSTDLLITLSYIHRQAGDTHTAFQVLHDALTIHRENARARMELAELYQQAGAPDLANWHLRSLAQIADESNDGPAAVEAWRKLYEISHSTEDHEQLALVLEKYNCIEQATAEYKDLASQARSENDIDRARRLFERIVELSPTDTEAHEALVAIYQSSGHDSQAVDKLRLLANVARHGGDLDGALRLYEDLVRRDPANVGDRTVLVELYLDKGLINNARSESQSLLEAWYRDNQFDLAIPVLQRFINAMPDDVVAREQLILFYEKAGESERSLEERLLLARMHVERGQAEDALKVYQKALGLDDRNAQVHYEMGVLHADHLNDPASAEQRFAKVQQLDPSHKDAIRRLVQLQLQLGKPHEAVARLAELIKLAPENASIRDELLVEYRRRSETHPEDAQSRFTLGLLYRLSGKVEDAIEVFQDTRKQGELFLQSCNMLGLCFLERRVPGCEDMAVRWFKRGIDTKGYVDSDDGYLELRYNLAELYNARNNVEEALKLYQDIYSVDIHYRDVAEKIQQIDDEMKGGGKVTRLRGR